MPPAVVDPAASWVVEPSGPLRGDVVISGSKNAVTTAAREGLGAEVVLGPAGLEAKASRLHGARIRLPFPGVGATENVLLSAVLAEGRTVIENGAVEPEVQELAQFLQRMGARIERRADRRWVIEGVDRLQGATRRLSGDRIEGLSYLVAGLAPSGRG